MKNYVTIVTNNFMITRIIVKLSIILLPIY